ncbi:hypothetical protein BKA64DRAFT_663549 [Cadophora sp. MPI-SDFR-AT-0126]|nr:hypothetical protein BKA64DRAFT_663549 [Leotiomycetes sp. MPI-SDFR-AT-0126]
MYLYLRQSRSWTLELLYFSMMASTCLREGHGQPSRRWSPRDLAPALKTQPVRSRICGKIEACRKHFRSCSLESLSHSIFFCSI